MMTDTRYISVELIEVVKWLVMPRKSFTLPFNEASFSWQN